MKEQNSVMKLYKPQTIDFDGLMKYYKWFFPIFYWECNLAAPIDRRMIRLSLFLKKHAFLCFVINLSLIMYILPASRCSNSNLIVAHLNIEIIIFINLLSMIIAFTPFVFHYDNFIKLWIELKAIDKLIFKRINHKINYRNFLQNYIKFSVITPPIFLIYAMLKIIYPAGTMTGQFRLPIILTKLAFLYIEFHAIFVIGVFQFIYEMVGKYAKFAYHLDKSNLVFPNTNTVFDNLKFYKEIHYKMWIISQEINRYFGLSLSAFCGQTFFDSIYSMYFFFHYWEHDNFSILKFISKFRVFRFLRTMTVMFM